MPHGERVERFPSAIRSLLTVGNVPSGRCRVRAAPTLRCENHRNGASERFARCEGLRVRLTLGNVSVRIIQNQHQLRPDPQLAKGGGIGPTDMISPAKVSAGTSDRSMFRFAKIGDPLTNIGVPQTPVVDHLRSYYASRATLVTSSGKTFDLGVCGRFGGFWVLLACVGGWGVLGVWGRLA